MAASRAKQHPPSDAPSEHISTCTYTVEDVRELKRQLAASAASELEPETSSTAAQTLSTFGLALVRFRGRRLVRKPWSAREAWTSEAFCRLHAEAGFTFTPIAFGVEAPPHVRGCYVQLLPDTIDGWRLMRDEAAAMASASVPQRQRQRQRRRRQRGEGQEQRRYRYTLPRLQRLAEAEANCGNRRQMALMDVLTGNYRHPGNVLVASDGDMFGVDHVYAFSTMHGGKIDGPVLGRTMRTRWTFTHMEAIDGANIVGLFDYEQRGRAGGGSGGISSAAAAGAADPPTAPTASTAANPGEACHPGLARHASFVALLRRLVAGTDEAIAREIFIPGDAVPAMRRRAQQLLTHGLERTTELLVEARDKDLQARVRRNEWNPRSAQFLETRIVKIFGRLPPATVPLLQVDGCLCSAARWHGVDEDALQPMYFCRTCARTRTEKGGGEESDGGVGVGVEDGEGVHHVADGELVCKACAYSCHSGAGHEIVFANFHRRRCECAAPSHAANHGGASSPRRIEVFIPQLGSQVEAMVGDMLREKERALLRRKRAKRAAALAKLAKEAAAGGASKTTTAPAGTVTQMTTTTTTTTKRRPRPSPTPLSSGASRPKQRARASFRPPSARPSLQVPSATTKDGEEEEGEEEEEEVRTAASFGSSTSAAPRGPPSSSSSPSPPPTPLEQDSIAVLVGSLIGGGANGGGGAAALALMRTRQQGSKGGGGEKGADRETSESGQDDDDDMAEVDMESCHGNDVKRTRLTMDLDKPTSTSTTSTTGTRTGSARPGPRPRPTGASESDTSAPRAASNVAATVGAIMARRHRQVFAGQTSILSALGQTPAAVAAADALPAPRSTSTSSSTATSSCGPTPMLLSTPPDEEEAEEERRKQQQPQQQQQQPGLFGWMHRAPHASHEDGERKQQHTAATLPSLGRTQQQDEQEQEQGEFQDELDLMEEASGGWRRAVVVKRNADGSCNLYLPSNENATVLKKVPLHRIRPCTT